VRTWLEQEEDRRIAIIFAKETFQAQHGGVLRRIVDGLPVSSTERKRMLALAYHEAGRFSEFSAATTRGPGSCRDIVRRSTLSAL
jgi:hypothetical protein